MEEIDFNEVKQTFLNYLMIGKAPRGVIERVQECNDYVCLKRALLFVTDKDMLKPALKRIHLLMEILERAGYFPSDDSGNQSNTS